MEGAHGSPPLHAQATRAPGAKVDEIETNEWDWERGSPTPKPSSERSDNSPGLHALGARPFHAQRAIERDVTTAAAERPTSQGTESSGENERPSSGARTLLPLPVRKEDSIGRHPAARRRSSAHETPIVRRRSIDASAAHPHLGEQAQKR
eukprot:1331439-Rhodomonas_salina.1